MISIISGIIVFAVVTSLMATASRKFEEDFRTGITQAFIYGVCSGVICMLAPKVNPWVAMILLIPMTILMLNIILWWKPNGSTLKEALIVSVVDLIMMWTAMSTAARIADITSIRWIVAVVRVLPVLVFILSVGFFISDIIFWREYSRTEDFDPEPYLSDRDEEEETDSWLLLLIKKIGRWIDNEEESYTLNNLGDVSDYCIDR